MIVKKRNITDFGIIGYECRSAENLIDGGDGVTIPPVVARIFFGQQKFAFDEVGKVDSAFCRIALLGFAIRINTLVNIDEGKNQRD